MATRNTRNTKPAAATVAAATPAAKPASNIPAAYLPGGANHTAIMANLRAAGLVPAARPASKYVTGLASSSNTLAAVPAGNVHALGLALMAVQAHGATRQRNLWGKAAGLQKASIAGQPVAGTKPTTVGGATTLALAAASKAGQPFAHGVGAAAIAVAGLAASGGCRLSNTATVGGATVYTGYLAAYQALAQWLASGGSTTVPASVVANLAGHLAGYVTGYALHGTKGGLYLAQ